MERLTSKLSEKKIARITSFYLVLCNLQNVKMWRFRKFRFYIREKKFKHLIFVKIYEGKEKVYY